MTVRHVQGFLLALLLLLAQGLWIAHTVDFAGHESDETCESCLHLAAFDYPANVSKTVVVTPSLQASTPIPTSIFFTQPPPLAQQARGPPVIFSTGSFKGFRQ
jgi:hypothetical protein